MQQDSRFQKMWESCVAPRRCLVGISFLYNGRHMSWMRATFCRIFAFLVIYISLMVGHDQWQHFKCSSSSTGVLAVRVSLSPAAPAPEVAGDVAVEDEAEDDQWSLQVEASCRRGLGDTVLGVPYLGGRVREDEEAEHREREGEETPALRMMNRSHLLALEGRVAERERWDEHEEAEYRRVYLEASSTTSRSPHEEAGGAPPPTDASSGEKVCTICLGDDGTTEFLPGPYDCLHEFCADCLDVGAGERVVAAGTTPVGEAEVEALPPNTATEEDDDERARPRLFWFQTAMRRCPVCRAEPKLLKRVLERLQSTEQLDRPSWRAERSPAHGTSTLARLHLRRIVARSLGSRCRRLFLSTELVRTSHGHQDEADHHNGSAPPPRSGVGSTPATADPNRPRRCTCDQRLRGRGERGAEADHGALDPELLVAARKLARAFCTSVRTASSSATASSLHGSKYFCLLGASIFLRPGDADLLPAGVVQSLKQQIGEAPEEAGGDESRGGAGGAASTQQGLDRLTLELAALHLCTHRPLKEENRRGRAPPDDPVLLRFPPVPAAVPDTEEPLATAAPRRNAWSASGTHTCLAFLNRCSLNLNGEMDNEAEQGADGILRLGSGRVIFWNRVNFGGILLDFHQKRCVKFPGISAEEDLFPKKRIDSGGLSTRCSSTKSELKKLRADLAIAASSCLRAPRAVDDDVGRQPQSATTTAASASHSQQANAGGASSSSSSWEWPVRTATPTRLTATTYGRTLSTHLETQGVSSPESESGCASAAPPVARHLEGETPDAAARQRQRQHGSHPITTAPRGPNHGPKESRAPQRHAKDSLAPLLRQVTELRKQHGHRNAVRFGLFFSIANVCAFLPMIYRLVGAHASRVATDHTDHTTATDARMLFPLPDHAFNRQLHPGRTAAATEVERDGGGDEQEENEAAFAAAPEAFVLMVSLSCVIPAALGWVAVSVQVWEKLLAIAVRIVREQEPLDDDTSPAAAALLDQVFCEKDALGCDADDGGEAEQMNDDRWPAGEEDFYICEMCGGRRVRGGRSAELVSRDAEDGREGAGLLFERSSARVSREMQMEAPQADVAAGVGGRGGEVVAVASVGL